MYRKKTNLNSNKHHREGVSFPKNETKPTINVIFGKPAEVQSVTIPRDKTPSANVQQFEVTFYAPDGNKINDKPISSSTSPKEDNTKPAQLDSTQIPSTKPVSRIEITILSTTDNNSPKAVILDIKACTETTTRKYSFPCLFLMHLTNIHNSLVSLLFRNNSVHSLIYSLKFTGNSNQQWRNSDSIFTIRIDKYKESTNSNRYSQYILHNSCIYSFGFNVHWHWKHPYHWNTAINHNGTM